MLRKSPAGPHILALESRASKVPFDHQPPVPYPVRVIAADRTRTCALELDSIGLTPPPISALAEREGGPDRTKGSEAKPVVFEV
jgi:hypothetical protein